MKKKNRVKAKHDKEDNRNLTPNARIIVDLMARGNVRGNYKDYAVLTGVTLVDWKGSYTVATNDGQVIGVKEAALIHKKRLRNILPSEIAERFWHPKLGRIGAQV